MIRSIVSKEQIHWFLDQIYWDLYDQFDFIIRTKILISWTDQEIDRRFIWSVPPYQMGKNIDLIKIIDCFKKSEKLVWSDRAYQKDEKIDFLNRSRNWSSIYLISSILSRGQKYPSFNYQLFPKIDYLIWSKRSIFCFDQNFFSCVWNCISICIKWSPQFEFKQI